MAGFRGQSIYYFHGGRNRRADELWNCLGLGKPNVIYVKNFIIREVPDQKLTDSCADLQPEHKKCADLQSEQGNHEECANLQPEAENREKPGTFLNCENHHSGVVKSTI